MNEFEWRLLEDKAPVNSLQVAGLELRKGDRVRLHPREGGDIMDIALAGKIATVEAIEQDYEGEFQLAVVIDDDPGRDIGMLRQPGHRFFFTPAEVEPLPPVDQVLRPAAASPSILIAGIGNIFLGDDAFGVEVVRRMQQRELPESVRVIDFGIRGFDLTYALIDGPDVTILVDACPRGGAAGDLYIIEPDLASIDGRDAPANLDAHGMNPMSVIRAAQTMGGPLKKILLLGCEPETLGPEEGQMGLSEVVACAVERSIPLLESIMKRVLDGEWPLEKT